MTAPSMPSIRGLALAAGTLALALLAGPAAAELTNQGLLDNVVTTFAEQARHWQGVIMNAASWLFWTLGTISLAWTMGTMVLRHADLGEFFAEFIRFIFFFGFFLWLLRNGPAFASAIIESLKQIGAQASGLPGVTPSSMVDIGFLVWTQAVSNLSYMAPISSLVGIFLSSAILLLLAAIAVNMLLLQVSGWILMYAGIFFLGFGGSRWTSDMAINYYKSVLGVAVQLLVMVLLVGIGSDLLETYYAKMTTTQHNFNELGVMLVFCLALLMVATKVPAMVAGMVTGGTGASSGIGSFGAGAVMGAAMGAASAASAGVGMAVSALGTGAAKAAGTQALAAACNPAANDAGGSDFGALAGAAGSDPGGPGQEGAFAPMDAGQSAASAASSADAVDSHAGGGSESADAGGGSGSDSAATGQAGQVAAFVRRDGP